MPIYKVPTPAKRTPKVQPQVQGIGSRKVDRVIFLKDDNIEFVKPCLPPPQPSPRVSSRAEFTGKSWKWVKRAKKWVKNGKKA